MKEFVASMVNSNIRDELALRDYLSRVQAVLNEPRCYKLDAMQRSSAPTECFDLLALVAQLACDVQRMAGHFRALLTEGHELGLSDQRLREIIGLDLPRLVDAYECLAMDLSAAGNRAIDLLGKAYP